MKSLYMLVIIFFSIFIFFIGLLFGSVSPVLGEHSKHNKVEVIYVEKPIEQLKVVEVPLHEYDSGLILYNTQFQINKYPIYQRYYGDCNLELKTVIYENQDFYWSINIKGCVNREIHSSSVYLNIKGNYVSINNAINLEYIYVSDLNNLSFIDKVEKTYNREDSY